jgi:cystathionine beta-lyase/cystathionine gamma-synthase
MSAIMTSLMAHLEPGDELVYTVPIYGGTQHLIEDFLEPWGVRGIPVRAGRTSEMEAAVRAAERLKVVLVETPANPTILMTDIAHAVAQAKTRGAKVFVDNTFLGPAFQHPLALGADLALYSATKYLGGFSDLLAGVAIAADAKTLTPIRRYRSLFGNILAPDECWILDSRLPTVELRMNKQSKNAQRIAERLANHPKVARMFYPSLFDDPEQRRIRDAQCDFPGAMFALELKGGKPAAFDFLRKLRLARNAVSLGGVETLVCHPKSTTHSGFSEEACEIAGVTDGLVRVSVGIEDWRDLLADFEQALEAA